MPEREHGFTPQNQEVEHDVSQKFLNSSDSEFAEYLGSLPEGAKPVLDIHIKDVDFEAIRKLLTKYETAQVIIRATEQDKELYKNKLPWARVEWRVEQ